MTQARPSSGMNFHQFFIGLNMHLYAQHPDSQKRVGLASIFTSIKIGFKANDQGDEQGGTQELVPECS